MIQLSDFKVGQEVIVVGGSVWRHEDIPKKVKVEKVGRKYVTIGPWERRFCVGEYSDCLIEKHEYGSLGLLYPTEEAYKRAEDRQRIEGKLRSLFGSYSNKNHISYEKLKRIEEIVDGKED